MDVEEIRGMLREPERRDQDLVGKNKFVRTAKEGDVTHLHAVGISNGALKRLVREYYRENKGEDFSKVLEVCDTVFRGAEYVEEHIFVCYLLERYRRVYTEELFSCVDKWIDLVDHWMSSDHIAINVMRHYPVSKHIGEIRNWVVSENIWRRRQSLTIGLKHLAEDRVREMVKDILGRLKGDRSYYVRKAITWVCSELGKVEPEWVHGFLEENILSFTKTELWECSKHVATRDELIALYESLKRKS